MDKICSVSDIIITFAENILAIEEIIFTIFVFT